MRLAWKLSIILLIAILCQIAIGPGAGTIDEAAFTVRVYIACLRGTPIDSKELIDDAMCVITRERERAWRQQSATTRPSFDPEEWDCEADPVPATR